MDNSKIQFSSEWDIKQIVFGETKNLTVVGGSYPPTQYLLKDFSSLGLTKPPTVIAKIKKQGESVWFLPGGGIYYSGFTPGARIDISINSTSIYLSSWLSGTHNITIEYYLLTGSASSV